MNINTKLIVVGKIKEEFYRNKIKEFDEVINKNNSIEIIELIDESIPQNPSDVVMEKIKEKEGSKILENINNADYVIALCIEGKQTSTVELDSLLKQCVDREYKNVVFVIGGSLGLSEKVVRRANYKLSFSKMTFPHQLMRVMLMEQLKGIICDK